MTSLRFFPRICFGFAFLSVILILPSITVGAPVVFSGTGANPAGIQAIVDTFRTTLGLLNPNVVGSFGSGRREINWDGVPDALSAPNNLPANFFNVNSPRGTIFSTGGTGFQVSANAGVAAVRFDNINPTYSNTFQTFSPQRLFTALGSNILRITSGNTALGPNDSTGTDVVVMDDFIYGEPSNVPEPATLVLLGSGLAGVVAAVRRRRQA